MKRKYFASLWSLAVTGVMLVIALFAMLSTSLGWFAKNNTVTASGLSVSVKGLPETEAYLIMDGVKLDAGAADLFAEMMPGEKRTAMLYVKNLSGKSIDITLYLSAATAETDTVYEQADLYHYFGSQIRLNSIKKTDSSDILNLTGTGKYLLTLDDSLYTGGLQPTGVPIANGEHDFSAETDKQLADTLTLAEDEEITLTFEFEFVDNGENQNAYISFADSSVRGKDTLNLSRTLRLYCDYTE